MWRLPVYLFFCLRVCQPVIAQSSPQRVTRLQLRQREQAGDTDFIVTKDSVVVQRHGLFSGKDTRYQRKLTPQVRNRLLASFDQTYLSAIQAHYECTSGLTCGPEFDITIEKGALYKKTMVIDCRVPFLEAFVTELNLLLPPAFHSIYVRYMLEVAKNPGLIDR